MVVRPHGSGAAQLEFQRLTTAALEGCSTPIMQVWSLEASG